MASLYKLTDLETRVTFNMNVLDARGIPQVMDLRTILQAFLDHRHEMLLNRSDYQLKKIEHRLEVLGGLLIAYLNLDEVIKIIREEDEPKPLMMKKWNLSDIQVEAILNMRLRSLRKLEEVEIRKERDNLEEKKKALLNILNDESTRWKAISDDIKTLKKLFGKNTRLGKRRTAISDIPDIDEDISAEAFIEKEAITIICSKKDGFAV